MTNTTMNDTPINPTRPVIITVICVIGAIGILLGLAATIALVFLPSDISNQVLGALPAWHMPYVGGSALLNIVSIIGLWQMRRWGLLVYILVGILDQIVVFILGQWNITNLIIPLIVIGVGAFYFKRMR